ncbi:uncharacterized protein DUF4333 [Saccharopolyspora erythraea NRRL 2338]|uniref:Uncharacterized protein n=2 Tax=Saccharopolyspora erythraea TaxID=1836 RepID=A4FBZ6_SACEN|nr:DUF4333 domain-containing protein [Saccharopolyspora erythraea]EQD84095.1 hypothetical protein N599_21850 [Saccharopolyspora erythraea D]PFG95343.1 uncharacterized protein DUF4333 [Saccharopolyspora erythraea NRRL 2338]QRK91987.1 DUF4333 domain-containing protein [Saccharopolyspora erythraea]CAM01571.1 hypothetical protein SACE_2266 [Saccharopolyspora erythraea NRRL 2338]
MTNPYGPPGGQQPPWGQQPQGPGPYPGGVPQSGYGCGQPGGYGHQGGYGGQPYGAPPAPYGQYPQGGFGGQPGFGGPAPEKRKRRALPWVLGGVVLVVVAAAVFVLGFVAPGWFVRSVFDAESVEKGVRQTLETSYRLGDVGPVTCPSGQAVQPGHSFDCRVTVEGRQQSVKVTVKNDKGTYEVGHPR